MKIYSMTNEDLAEALEVIARSDELKTHFLFGFEDDKKKEYPSPMFLQEAASRLVMMKYEKPKDEDAKPAVDQTTIVIPTHPEEQKPDEEPTPTEREVLKKAVVMLAEAVKDRRISSAFDTCNKVIEMMRKLERKDSFEN